MTRSNWWRVNDSRLDIGRNGAGKSTLLKTLSRITEPSEGRVEVTGRVASLLEVGTGFHPELTGRENIYLNGAILGMERAEIRRKFEEIVAFAEVKRFLDTRCGCDESQETFASRAPLTSWIRLEKTGSDWLIGRTGLRAARRG
ncbi:MAG TPA: ATP-binding cassette domain-containing protein [Pyrinomonadaceae bacterium]